MVLHVEVLDVDKSYGIAERTTTDMSIGIQVVYIIAQSIGQSQGFWIQVGDTSLYVGFGSFGSQVDASFNVKFSIRIVH